MRRIQLIFAALISATFWNSELTGTMPLFIQARIDAEISIATPRTVGLNERFRVKLNVRVKGYVPHYSNSLDMIEIRLPSYCEVDSGAVVWRGKLDHGSSVGLVIVARATQAGSCEVNATVAAAAAVDDATNFVFRNSATFRELKVSNSASSTGPIAHYNDFTVSGGAESHPLLRVTKAPDRERWDEYRDTLAHLPGPIIHCTNLQIDSLRTGRARIEYYSGTMNFLRITPTPVEFLAGIEYVTAECGRIHQREASLNRMLDGWMEVDMYEPLEHFVAQLKIADGVFPLTVVRVEIPDSLGPYKTFRPFPKGAPVIQYSEISLDSLRTGKAEFEYRAGTSNWIRFTEYDAEVSLYNPVVPPDKWDVGGHFRLPPNKSDEWLNLGLWEPFDTTRVNLEFKGEKLSLKVRYPTSRK